MKERVALACGCSICRKKGYLHVIVENDALEVLSGGDSLVEYRFNTETARHFHCAICGVSPWYVPRSHPDGWSVNLRCLDGDAHERFEIRPFDGANWEASIHEIV